jgi:DNA-binding winged helix-turn-helix (wHTH) protein
MTERSRTLLRFGTFDIDPLPAELFRSGRKVHLAPQAFQLLLLLVNRAGDMVSREEIRRSLWPDGTFVDFDAAVNACISQIRTVLGDRATTPRFIETLPRRGYRFIAPIERVDSSVPVIAGVVTAPNVTPTVSMTQSIALTALALVGAVALFAATMVADHQPDAARSLGVDVLQKFERARSGLEDASPGDLLDRVKMFEAVLARAPEFADAYIGLADAKLLLATYRTEDPQSAYAAAKAAAGKAFAIDRRRGDAHGLYAAATLLFDWNFEDASRHFERALTLSPRSPRVHHWYARYLTAIGRHGEAVDHARRAVALRATSPHAVTHLGVALFYAGRYPEARLQCGRAAALMPEFTPAAQCLRALDSPQTTTAGLPDLYLSAAVDALAGGDRTAALDHLQRAANRHSDALVFASVHPSLASLHDEPRFQFVLERVGLRAVAKGRR